MTKSHRDKDIVVRARKGQTHRSIADHYGISPARVGQIVRDGAHPHIHRHPERAMTHTERKRLGVLFLKFIDHAVGINLVLSEVAKMRPSLMEMLDESVIEAWETMARTCHASKQDRQSRERDSA